MTDFETSLNVVPTTTMHNMTDAGWCDVVSSCERRATYSFRPLVSNSKNVRNLEFCLPTLLALWLILWAFIFTSFGAHIELIVGSSPKEKMSRITASTVVALVKHAKSVMDMTVSYNPRCAVSAIQFAAPHYGSVSGAASAFLPLPTFINSGHGDSAHDSFLVRCGHCEQVDRSFFRIHSAIEVRAPNWLKQYRRLSFS